MKKLKYSLWIVLFFGFWPAIAAEPNWAEQMRQFKSTLGDLLPYIASEKSFNEPENAITIQSKIKKLGEIRNIQSHPMVQNSSDPTLAYISASFNENLTMVDENLKAGRRDYARYLLMNTTSYCIECHTRTTEKPEFFDKQVPGLVGLLGPIEKVEYLVATRQFREALTSIEDALKSENFAALNINSDVMARYGLILSARYFQDPAMTENFIKKIDGPGVTPFFLQQDIQAWRKTIAEWKKTKQPDLKNKEKSIQFVETLVKKSADVNRKLKSDHAGDLYALRAYSIASSLLKEQLSKPETSKVLMLMGDSHQDATDSLFWTLPRYYYEACIKTTPHSEQARQCYSKYEAAARFEYSGATAMIPFRLLGHMKELKALSEPESQKN